METTIDIKYQISENFYKTYIKEYHIYKYNESNIDDFNEFKQEFINNSHPKIDYFNEFKQEYINNIYNSPPKIVLNIDYDELIFFLQKINDNAGDFFSDYHLPQKVFEIGLYYLTKEIINNVKENDLKQKFLVIRIKELQEEIKKIKEYNKIINDDNDKLKEDNDKLKEDNDKLKEDNDKLKEDNDKMKENNDKMKENNDIYGKYKEIEDIYTYGKN